MVAICRKPPAQQKRETPKEICASTPAYCRSCVCAGCVTFCVPAPRGMSHVSSCPPPKKKIAQGREKEIKRTLFLYSFPFFKIWPSSRRVKNQSSTAGIIFPTHLCGRMQCIFNKAASVTEGDNCFEGLISCGSPHHTHTHTHTDCKERDLYLLRRCPSVHGGLPTRRMTGTEAI